MKDKSKLRKHLHLTLSKEGVQKLEGLCKAKGLSQGQALDYLLDKVVIID